MVDATSIAEPASFQAAAAPASQPAGLALARAISLEAYADLCGTAVFAPAQSHAFVSAWIGEVRTDHLLVALWESGRPVLALPLDITRQGPFRVARFVGGSHANGNFPPCNAEWAGNADQARWDILMQAIRNARPDIDLVLLERMAQHVDGVTNPMLGLPHRLSPNIALSTNLAGGFDALLERTGRKRKRKKHRAQTRKYEAAGGLRVFTARTPEEVDRLWDAFLTMKEHRFRKMGIPNVFAETGVRSFFRTLFVQQLRSPSPIFTLEALEVDGVLRAVSGSSRRPGQITCEFGAIAEDDLSHTSPGDFLFHESIRNACESGYSFYDFGVGDEPYKRLWCDREDNHFDVAVPLSAKGRVLSLALAALASAKSQVKNNPTLWSLVKRARRRTSGEAAAAED